MLHLHQLLDKAFLRFKLIKKLSAAAQAWSDVNCKLDNRVAPVSRERRLTCWKSSDLIAKVAEHYLLKGLHLKCHTCISAFPRLKF